MKDETHLKLTAYVRENEFISNCGVLEAVFEKIKVENWPLNVFVDRISCSIDETGHCHNESIEILSNEGYLRLNVIGVKSAVENFILWFEKVCPAGIAEVEDTKVVFCRFKNDILNGRIKISEIMFRNFEYAYEDDTLAEVVQKFYDRKIRFLPVIEHETTKVKGIITEGDLIKHNILPFKLKFCSGTDDSAYNIKKLDDDLNQQKHIIAADIMNSQVICVFEDEIIKNTLVLMNRHKLKRLPVLKRTGAIAGILSRLDIFKKILSSESAASVKPECGKNVERIKKTDPGKGLADSVKRDENEGSLASVSKFIDPEYPALKVNDNFEMAVSRLQAYEYTFIPIIDDNFKIRGLITDDQIMKNARFEINKNAAGNFFVNLFNLIFKRDENLFIQYDKNLKISQVMEKYGDAVIDENAPLTYALSRMIDLHLKMLVVKDGGGNYRGIISRRNIMKLLYS
ncbi:MAG: CBS domain-containing protein [Candidatus Wallbacteria bacterium]